ncbi:MAG: MFS transporter [Proteobacteria bacterium]|nr:MFS transporter [Pseudomonadota bacterium]MBU1611516.1 MFS transporter [Pseudomonadota bacterium]
MSTPTPAAPAGAPKSRPALHYGWVVALTGTLVIFACLGLARFSFGMLLPSMASALELTYAQRGQIGTAYFIGYLLMVALAPTMGRRVGNRAAIGLGLGIVGSGMCLLGLAGGFGSAMLLYGFTGVGSGLANVCMMALIAAWFAPSRRGLASGVVAGGSGLAIIFSGLLIPEVVAGEALLGVLGWRAGWLLLGVITLGTTILAATLLRNTPADVGLAILGNQGHRPVAPDESGRFSRSERSFIARLGLLYLIFGLTYIIYATFIVTTLVDEHGMPPSAAGRFWAIVGIFSVFSGPLFGRLSDRFSRKAGLMAALSVQSAAYLLAGLGTGTLTLYLSVGFFGLAAWSIPTIMTAAIADRLGASRTATGFAIITFFFAVGQVVGPLAAGYLADATGSFGPSYTASGCLTGLGVFLAYRLLTRSPRQANPAG